MKRVVHVSLTDESIDKAIAELYAYQKWLELGAKKLLAAMGEMGIEIASARFEDAIYAGTNDVSVKVEDRGQMAVAVVAVGNATLFIEFGTGINNPNSHPEARTHGIKHGEYGHHLGGLRGGWYYKGDPGNAGTIVTEGNHAGEVHTLGNPANMSMWLTMKDLEAEFSRLAKEAFNGRS